MLHVYSALHASKFTPCASQAGIPLSDFVVVLLVATLVYISSIKMHGLLDTESF